MSNQVIGTIYSTIIDKIIADSKDDFEQAGLDQETLQELKQTWQKNITNLDIAHCPWDPPPAQQQIANPPTVPSNVKPEQHYKQEQFKQEQYKQENSNTSNSAPRAANDVPIKQEQGIKYEPQSYQPQQGYGGLNPQFAAQRRDQLLQQQYGSQADASIQAAQARQMQMPGGQQRPTHIQMPPRPGQPTYGQQQSSMGAAQSDGASDALADWRAEVAARRATSEQDRIHADHMLREYLEQSAALDDGGLLLPASEQARKSKKIRNMVPVNPEPLPSTPAGPGRFDGPNDEDNKDDVKKAIEGEENDEDAINSDLDDSEEEGDNVDDEDADGPMGETILCTYDKVQRVKNKWKCTLKDGILTTNKKEYVFHKAQGEFEW